MAKAERRERSTALYETILKLRDLEECRRFFEDLCTPTELQAMEQRFDVAVYLQQGLVYLDILEKTGASSATISRVRRSMLENGAGGVVQSIIIREGLDKPEPPEGMTRIRDMGSSFAFCRKAGKKNEAADAGQRGRCPWTL